MIKVVNVEDITKQLYKILDDYYYNLLNSFINKGYKLLWFGISYRNYQLIFIRKYSICDDYDFSIKEWHTHIDKFVNTLDFTGKVYVDVEIFGNGILFNSFVDIYNIIGDEK